MTIDPADNPPIEDLADRLRQITSADSVAGQARLLRSLGEQAIHLADSLLSGASEDEEYSAAHDASMSAVAGLLPKPGARAVAEALLRRAGQPVIQEDVIADNPALWE